MSTPWIGIDRCRCRSIRYRQREGWKSWLKLAEVSWASSPTERPATRHGQQRGWIGNRISGSCWPNRVLPVRRSAENLPYLVALVVAPLINLAIA